MINEISLNTNDDNSNLSISGIQFAGNEEYFSSDIYVLSRGFSCRREFFFDRFNADRFISSLDDMNNGKTTKATLKQEWEEDYLQFSNDNLGNVVVSGQIIEHSSSNMIRFCINTDQTVLKDFLERFRNALSGLPDNRISPSR